MSVKPLPEVPDTRIAMPTAASSSTTRANAIRRARPPLDFFRSRGRRSGRSGGSTGRPGPPRGARVAGSACVASVSSPRTCVPVIAKACVAAVSSPRAPASSAAAMSSADA